MATVSVRYIVYDVDQAIAFYCEHLGFREVMHPAPQFAMLSRGDLRLVLSAPGGGPGGGAAMPDGTLPSPGGWNRFSIEVEDLDALVRKAASAGGPISQSGRERGRRAAGADRGPLRQSGRAVPAHDRRGQAVRVGRGSILPATRSHGDESGGAPPASCLQPVSTGSGLTCRGPSPAPRGSPPAPWSAR